MEPTRKEHAAPPAGGCARQARHAEDSSHVSELLTLFIFPFLSESMAIEGSAPLHSCTLLLRDSSHSVRIVYPFRVL